VILYAVQKLINARVMIAQLAIRKLIFVNY